MRTADGYIISKCLNDGDSTAFGLLVDKYKASIYALAYSKLHNFHDAEDVTQEVFVKAYRNLRKLRRWDNFFAWLYSITSNLCKDFLQEKAKFSDSEFIEDQSVDMLKTSSIRSFHDEMAFESIREALDSLPEIYQQVLTLHYLGGMTGEEISEFLGVPHPTIRQRLSRARSMLKEEMIAMMNTGYEQRRLSANFTFRIIEMVKKIRIHPTSGIKGLPYGLSIGAGIIFAILSFGQHIQINLSDIAMGLPIPNDMKVLKVGEIPVDAVKISTIPFIASKGDGKGITPVPKGQENAFFMASQGEGGTWEKRKDLPNATTYASSAEIDGKIYIIGGAPNLTINQMYDPASDSWEQKAKMPVGALLHTTTVYNGKIYVIGGCVDDPNNPPISTIWEYDPKNDKWQQKKDMPSPLSCHSAVVYSNKIYVFGGESNNGVAAFSVYLYDSNIDQWEQLKDIPREFQMDGSVAINYKDKIYFFGGTNAAQGVLLNHVLIFDPLKESWKWSKQIIPTQRLYPGAGIINNKVYLIGGYAIGFIAYSDVDEYNIDLDEWTTKTEMPSKRAFLGTSQLPVVNGKIYVIGGETFDPNPLSTNEVYIPDTVDSKSVDPSGKLPKTWGMLKAK